MHKSVRTRDVCGCDKEYLGKSLTTKVKGQLTCSTDSVWKTFPLVGSAQLWQEEISPHLSSSSAGGKAAAAGAVTRGCGCLPPRMPGDPLQTPPRPGT